MAHCVESMAFTGATPWHGLGKQLTENQPIEVWAQEAGMDWEIKETPVRFMSDGNHEKSALLTYPERKVLFRSDTQEPLSVVSQRYQVVQPREILEFYRDLTEMSGFQLHTAGVLKGGRKVWALAKTGQSTLLRGNDLVEGYVLLATACDGTLATTAQFTSVRVVCHNTLSIALDKGQGVVRVPHSTQFNPQAVKDELGISVTSWDAFMYRMKHLSERKVSHKEAKDFFLTLFSTQSQGNATPLATQPMKKALALYEGHGRGAELNTAKGTALGLLNSITEFIDHERRAHSQDHRLDSAWFGQGATLKQKALNQSLALLA